MLPGRLEIEIRVMNSFFRFWFFDFQSIFHYIAHREMFQKFHILAAVFLRSSAKKKVLKNIYSEKVIPDTVRVGTVNRADLTFGRI